MFMHAGSEGQPSIDVCVPNDNVNWLFYWRTPDSDCMWQTNTLHLSAAKPKRIVASTALSGGHRLQSSKGLLNGTIQSVQR